MEPAVGGGLLLAGRLSEGLRFLKGAIASGDAGGERTIATLNRLTLAEVYLEMISSRQMPPLSVILRNLPIILGAKLFGARRARALLEQASRHEQLHERGAIRARINMNLGLLYKLKKKPELARQFLERARGPAELHGVGFIVSKIDAALSELQ
jgi:hypothetical protein